MEKLKKNSEDSLVIQSSDPLICKCLILFKLIYKFNSFSSFILEEILSLIFFLRFKN